MAYKTIVVVKLQPEFMATQVPQKWIIKQKQGAEEGVLIPIKIPLSPERGLN